MVNNTDLTIMYSGGLDSLIAYNYAKKIGYTPLCIFVNLGQENWNKELNSIEQNTNKFPEYTPDLVILNLNELVPLIKSRLTNQIIPSRNVLLATIGGMFNSRVWINALDGESNGKENDKSNKFFKDTTDLLTFTNNFFQKETIVESPFKYMTKSETISWAINNDIPKDLLINTSSCYSENYNKCGNCLTCYKRYTSFLLNDIYDECYTVNPLLSDYAKEMDLEIPKAKENKDYSRFTPKRIEEYFKLQNKINELHDIFKE